MMQNFVRGAEFYHYIDSLKQVLGLGNTSRYQNVVMRTIQ